jgi:hypothetical protein
MALQGRERTEDVEVSHESENTRVVHDDNVNRWRPIRGGALRINLPFVTDSPVSSSSRSIRYEFR